MNSLVWRRKLILLAVIVCTMITTLSPTTKSIQRRLTITVRSQQLSIAPSKTLIAQLIAQTQSEEAHEGTVFDEDWGIPKGGDFDSLRNHGKRFHKAYDLARKTESTTLNQPAYAPLSGRVEYTSDANCGHGLILYLDETQLDLVYCHLANAKIKLGKVKAGERIATIGKSGSANYPGGAHLHISGHRRLTHLYVRLNQNFLQRTVVRQNPPV